MKVLLQSAAYWPNLGGIETAARLLAEEFTELGHSTVVLTETPSDRESGTGVTVLRRASLAQTVAALREADVVLMFGLSLRFLALPLLLRRPTVVCHHGWYGGAGPMEWLKRACNRAMRNIAPSQAVARALRAPATVIPNPYDDSVFRLQEGIEPTDDLVFVGRLVSDKGLASLIEALAVLAGQGLRPALAVIGSGPEEARCRQAAAAAGVDRQLTWLGEMRGDALATELGRHRILVVPSLWNEPFGIVALEALACGCAVVGSSGGGLPEAIGPGGRTFANGDAGALAEALRATLQGAPPSRAAVTEHLARHTRRAVAQRYLEVLQSAVRA